MGQAEFQKKIYSDFSDDEEYRDLLKQFVNSTDQKIEQLVSSFQKNDLEQLQTLAHQLKGAGGGYGFPGLTEFAAELENSCKTNSVDDLEEKLNNLVQHLSQLSV